MIKATLMEEPKEHVFYELMDWLATNAVAHK
jgi:hypothetical protein